jgi:hypothetical protein
VGAAVVVVVVGAAVVVVVVGAAVVVVVGGRVVVVDEAGGRVVLVVGTPSQPALSIRTLQDAASSPPRMARRATRAAQLTYRPRVRAGQHSALAAARVSSTPSPVHRPARLSAGTAHRRVTRSRMLTTNRMTRTPFVAHGTRIVPRANESR